MKIHIIDIILWLALLEALILAQDKGEFGTYQIPIKRNVKGPKVHIKKIIYKEAGKESTREVEWNDFERFGRPLTFSEGTRIILDDFAKQNNFLEPSETTCQTQVTKITKNQKIYKYAMDLL